MRRRLHEARIEEDYESGARSGIPSTPRFFVNGRIHLGSPTGPDLRRAVEAGSRGMAPRARPGPR